MAGLVLRRVRDLVIVLFLVGTAMFFIIHLIPGNPAIALLGPFATQEQITAGQVLWYDVSCPGQANYPIFTLLGQPVPGPPPPTPGELAAMARQVMQLPAPVVRHNPTDAGLVNLATWLWLDEGSWTVRCNSLRLRGTNVTVVAKPAG